MSRWRNPEVLVPLAVATAAAVLFGLTLCPTVYWYDSAEFAAKAAALKVPHPPGYPLYTMIAHAFTWLPGEPALDVNLMSLIFGVATVALLTVLTRRLGASHAGAAVAGGTLATMSSFWGNAVVTEVYTPGLFFTLGVIVLLERAHALSKPGLLTWAGLVGGLGVGMHMSIATFGLGYIWLVATYGIHYRHPRDLRGLAREPLARLLRMLKSAVAAAVGLLVFAFVPIRSFERWDMRDWVIFRKNTMGGTFKRKLLKDYVFEDRLDLVVAVFVENLLYIGLALAAVGALVLLARRPKLGIGVLLCALGNSWWFFNYRVPDLDVFYLPSMAVACLCVGFGADGIADALRRVSARAGHARWLALALPMFLVARNYAKVDLSGYTEAAEYGQRACAGVPEGARVLLYSSPDEWRYYSVFLYMQLALGECEGVEVWKKPKLSAIHKALAADEPLYLFYRVGRVSGSFEIVDNGGLLLLRRRKREGAAAREHHRPD